MCRAALLFCTLLEVYDRNSRCRVMQQDGKENIYRWKNIPRGGVRSIVLHAQPLCLLGTVGRCPILTDFVGYLSVGISVPCTQTFSQYFKYMSVVYF